MSQPVNQSTALELYKEPKIPYANQGSTAYFIQSEVERGEQMVAGRFTGLAVMGKESARLASQVASRTIFNNLHHSAGKIIQGYCEDLRFVRNTQLGRSRETVSQFYVPNFNRPAFNNTPGPGYIPWATLRWSHLPDLEQAQQDFAKRLKAVKEREERDGIVPLSFEEMAKHGLNTSVRLLQSIDPDIQGKN